MRTATSSPHQHDDLRVWPQFFQATRHIGHSHVSGCFIQQDGSLSTVTFLQALAPMLVDLDLVALFKVLYVVVVELHLVEKVALQLQPVATARGRG